MRILYDGAIYRIQQYGGVVRYFNGLIHQLPESTHPILLASCDPPLAPSHPNLITHIESESKRWWAIKPWRKQIIARRAFESVLAFKPDVWHPTYYSTLLRQWQDRIDLPTVLTVYDLIHEKFPDQMDPSGKQRRLKRDALHRADSVICISQATRNDLLEFYSIPEERISVIYPGCAVAPSSSGDSSPDVDEESQISDDEYFLYVGARIFYKNFDRLLEAFSNVIQSHRKMKLRCIGGNPFSSEESQLMCDLGVSEAVERIGFVEDAEMQKYYKNALAIVYPSLYEGFGVPILEGMTYGTPVLTSNLASMPEVAGDAAVLFDPYSVDEMTESMLNLVEDRQKRVELIERGHLRAKEFAPSFSASQTLEIYRSLTRKSEVAA